TNEAGIAQRNLKTGIVWSLDQAFEKGSWVPAPGFARSFNGFIDAQKPFYQALIGYNDISPNYNPIDGFTTISDIRGFNFLYNPNGSTPAIKNWNIFAWTDRFFDRSGAIHEADTQLFFNATFKNGLSLNGVGGQIGLLRSYAADDPNRTDSHGGRIYPGGCGDPNLPFTSFTGYPNYFCGRTDRFNLAQIALGYRDGTPSPIDFTVAEGPFGPNFTHLYQLTTSRPIGTRFSVSAEYDGTVERSFSTGALQSQWLRRLTIGETLGQDANLSFSLRTISGLGGFATPGVNFSASYHRHFANGGDLYINYGTPASTTTLNRLVLKYVFRVGGSGAGT
ncbi:MAG: hypothetical protein JOZ59_06020, partial [Candidatus Eremiobacteraeota bacterium]|nr:hypothetical protein [Candidatus Eremiobacteraeota bacterium]